jgi:hypothetical protein
MICQNFFHLFCSVKNKYPFNKRELMGLETHLLINAFKTLGFADKHIENFGV